MKILTAFLIFISISLSAQNHRFVYEYTFVKDSLNKDKTTTEAMTLDITEKGSKYYSYEVYASDSIENAEIEKQIRSGSNNIIIPEHKTSGTVKSIIQKEYPNYSVNQFEKLAINNFNVEDDRKMVWKILPETMKIGEFNSQKATIEMFGRKWIAWFSTDLPFQDGPYKFHGLPGLIVKVEDVTQSHIIELKGVKILPKNFIFLIKKEDLGGETITLNYTKFKKAFKDNRENPAKWIRQAMGGTEVKISMTDANGKSLSMNEIIRNQEEKAKEANKKNNNLLELDLLK